MFHGLNFHRDSYLHFMAYFNVDQGVDVSAQQSITNNCVFLGHNFVGLPRSMLLSLSMQSLSIMFLLMLLLMFNGSIIFCVNSIFLSASLCYCFVTINLLSTWPLILLFMLAIGISTFRPTKWVKLVKFEQINARMSKTSIG